MPRKKKEADLAGAEAVVDLGVPLVEERYYARVPRPNDRDIPPKMANRISFQGNLYESARGWYGPFTKETVEPFRYHKLHHTFAPTFEVVTEAQMREIVTAERMRDYAPVTAPIPIHPPGGGAITTVELGLMGPRAANVAASQEGTASGAPKRRSMVAGE